MATRLGGYASNWLGGYGATRTWLRNYAATELRGYLLWLMDLRTRYNHVQLRSRIAIDSRCVLEWQGILQVSQICKHGQLFQFRFLPHLRWEDRQLDPQNGWKSSLEQPTQVQIVCYTLFSIRIYFIRISRLKFKNKAEAEISLKTIDTILTILCTKLFLSINGETSQQNEKTCTSHSKNVWNALKRFF